MLCVAYNTHITVRPYIKVIILWASPISSQAVDAFSEALKIGKIENQPQQLSRIQNNYGLALISLSEHKSGEDEIELLSRAAAAYRTALKLRPREKWPQHWARIKDNLGTVLRKQGELTQGEAGIEFLSQAAEAYRAA